ncbi:hypothetical protein GBAR_LOCUS9864, partial [Geodia barretti]
CDECQARSVGLVRYPTTLAPASGSVTVATQCADNAHVRTGFSLNVRCSSSGGWSGTTPQCECDTGYRAVTLSGRQICQSVNTCPARSFGLVDYPTTLAPVSGSVTVATQCADNAHVRTGFSLNVRCSSSGSWTGTTPQCECDTGYRAVTVSGRKICQTDETTCPPTTDPPSIGAVNETKVLGCGLISWKPPPGNEGVKLSYVVRFFDGSTYDTSSGYKRIQRNSEIGRQWTRVNDIPDGRTVYADIRARNTSGNVGVFSQKFVVANSTLCADDCPPPVLCPDCDECQARNAGLVHYPTTLAPASGSLTVTTQCADNAHVRTGFSLNVMCSSSGSWTGTTPQCECDTGYRAVTVSGRQICQTEETTCPPTTGVTCAVRTVGLVRYPTTLAPASGSVTVSTQCADNAHVRTGFSLNVRCSSSGGWTGTTPQCECDTGYRAVTVSGRKICQTDETTCPPTTDPPSIGAVNETKVLGCGLISWKPPPGNEGVKLSYVVRFFDGSTYETSTSGYKRIQRNSEIGRQWTRVNDIPDGRTVYADIRARNTSGNVGLFLKNLLLPIQLYVLMVSFF